MVGLGGIVRVINSLPCCLSTVPVVVGSVAATTRPAVYASFEATTTQEIHSRETEEEQPQVEVTETAAEPEAEQEEADQMRDTEVGSAALATPSPAYAAFDLPPGWEQWSTRLSLGDGTGEGNEAGGPRPLPLNWLEMSTKQKELWRKTQRRKLAKIRAKDQKPKN